jgi:hypothetical protein
MLTSTWIPKFLANLDQRSSLVHLYENPAKIESMELGPSFGCVSSRFHPPDGCCTL